MGQVRTFCPTRAVTAFSSDFLSNAKARTATPGRPSKVSDAATLLSMPASASQPITLDAFPQNSRAAIKASSSSTAVMINRAARIGNASAKVSSIVGRSDILSDSAWHLDRQNADVIFGAVDAAPLVDGFFDVGNRIVDALPDRLRDRFQHPVIAQFF